MGDVSAWVFLFLIFPGMLFSVVLGLSLSWVDRKVTALVQWRKGPPLTQPYWDVIKLLGKEVILPAESWVNGFLTLPFVAFSAAALAATMVWLAVLQTGPTALGDLFVVLYLLSIPSLAVILGGAASGNPLGAIGASRDMKLVLGFELPFVIALLVAVFQTRPDVTGATTSLAGLQALQHEFGSVLFGPPGSSRSSSPFSAPMPSWVSSPSTSRKRRPRSVKGP